MVTTVKDSSNDTSSTFQMGVASVTSHSTLQVLESSITSTVGPVVNMPPRALVNGLKSFEQFIGNILNWMFLGILIMQLYTYYQSFPCDRIAIRVLVYTVFVLDVAHTIMLTHHGWWFIVTSWGNPQIFSVLVWSAGMIPFMAGLMIGTIVQIFYAVRIWRLAPNTLLRAAAIIIVLVSLCQSIIGMVSGILLLRPPDVNNIFHLHPELSTLLAASLADDILITASMTYIDGAACQGQRQTSWIGPESLLTTLINRVVITGAATTVGAAIDLAMFIGYPTTNYHIVPSYILGKFYTNSLMLTLNLRRPHAVKNYSESMPMSPVRFASGTWNSQGGVHVAHTTCSNTGVVGNETKWDHPANNAQEHQRINEGAEDHTDDNGHGPF
ncbi:hypothetical protein C8J57DRAFT_1723842 [Mycena rebaudengoi]|nr:hypothetical protein C8J57DRAFT_1723842 [Mycena rebaudengoi]